MHSFLTFCQQGPATIVRPQDEQLRATLIMSSLRTLFWDGLGEREMLIVVIWRHLVKLYGQGKASERQLDEPGRVVVGRCGSHCDYDGEDSSTAAVKRFAASCPLCYCWRRALQCCRRYDRLYRPCFRPSFVRPQHRHWPCEHPACSSILNDL